MGFDSGLRFDPESKRVLMMMGAGALCGLLVLFGSYFLVRSASVAFLAYAVPWFISALYSGVLPIALLPFRKSIRWERRMYPPRLLQFFIGYRWAWLPAFFIAVWIALVES